MYVEAPGNWRPALKAAAKAFAARHPLEMADWSGAAYDPAGRCFELDYAGEKVQVSYPEASFNLELSVSDRTIILLYLSGARGLPLRNQWLTFMELPNGPHHRQPFENEALRPLCASFGREPHLLAAAAVRLGGSPLAMGDAAVRLLVLPRLPLAVVVWAGDEEFPARANILFDASAPGFLDTAALYALGINTALRLCRLKEL